MEKDFITKYIEIGGKENFEIFKKKLIDEFNSLNIPGLKVDDLYWVNGSDFNLEYLLPNKEKVKFLDDEETYLGSEIECEFNDSELKRYFCVICNSTFLLVSEYNEDKTNPEIIIYKSR